MQYYFTNNWNLCISLSLLLLSVYLIKELKKIDIKLLHFLKTIIITEFSLSERYNSLLLTLKLLLTL